MWQGGDGGVEFGAGGVKIGQQDAGGAICGVGQDGAKFQVVGDVQGWIIDLDTQRLADLNGGGKTAVVGGEDSGIFIGDGPIRGGRERQGLACHRRISVAGIACVPVHIKAVQLRGFLGRQVTVEIGIKALVGDDLQRGQIIIAPGDAQARGAVLGVEDQF